MLADGLILIVVGAAAIMLFVQRSMIDM